MQRRGSLRIYLGASPGVGKTFAMLNEGCRRKERGADVVVGVVETHQRQQTKAQLRDLEIVPRRSIEYRGAVLDEMDLDAILQRRPGIVLVDEFAHTNVVGSRNEKRWQDVEALLDAGIDVISTLNIQHLESLNDVITKITGTVQRETVPDAIVRRADQIELVDMSPEAIRRRMAHGNIYPAERIDAALSNYFRPGNLGALRELALLWVANRVEESLSSYLADHGITEAWETRERVVVGITGRRGGEALIRRASRIAGRVGGDMLGVHVVVGDGLTQEDGDALAEQRRLVAQLGGTVHEVVGQARAETLVEFARLQKATQLVLGATRRSRWYEVLHGSFVATVTRLAGDIDVHVIARSAGVDHESTGSDDGPRSTPSMASSRGGRRIVAAWILTVAGIPGLTALTSLIRDHVELSTELLVFLSFVLLISALGGRIVAAVAAVAASVTVNWYFVEPVGTLTINEPEHLVALIVFVLVAVTVGSLVDTAARRSLEARRARVEAEALARSAAQLAADPEPLPGLVEQLRLTFGLNAVRLVRAEDGLDQWAVVAESGAPEPSGLPPLMLGLATVSSRPHRLELYGRVLSADDQRVMRVLADQLGVAVDGQHLAREAAGVAALTEIDAVRTAMLRAVSHDLRTPLASIKAMISGLRDESVAWTPAQTAEALATVDEETDRLNRLVGNLLDASRLQIGAFAVQCRDSSLIESIGGSLHSLGASADAVSIELPDDLPLVWCDTTLLERSLANVISNALRHSPTAGTVRLTAGVVPGVPGDEVHVCIIDRGPGIPHAERERVLAPFQRLGDNPSGDGVGLGLAIAQGFVEAMGGHLTLDDTPGGGLTVTICLPVGSAMVGVGHGSGNE